jgi:hypothetical protein
LIIYPILLDKYFRLWKSECIYGIITAVNLQRGHLGAWVPMQFGNRRERARLARRRCGIMTASRLFARAVSEEIAKKLGVRSMFFPDVYLAASGSLHAG